VVQGTQRPEKKERSAEHDFSQDRARVCRQAVFELRQLYIERAAIISRSNMENEPRPPPEQQQRWGAYIAATLQPDERPIHQTHIHWIALSGAVIGAILCLIVIVPIAMFAAWRGFYWAWLLLVIPVGIVLSAALTIKTSELVITDRRVLIKVGFIQRHTFEMFISKIESVAVFQSMAGRLLNYGTVEIRGTGGSSESFATIAAPLPFRDAIQLVQTHSERR
jgi:Bacterial PH domain